MKKLIVSLSAVAALVAVLLTATQTRGQGQAPAGQARSTRPHQIGLIDMAYVFNNYKKFTDLQDSVKASLQGTQDQAKKMVEAMNAKAEQIRSGEIKKDSPEYRKIEAELISGQAQLEALSKVTQNENLRKEAEIYREIYLEVQRTIQIYADHYGYTLIMRFDRESVAEATDPQQVLQRLTRQVVYHRGEDDLTMVILNQLNRQYEASGARPASTATAPTSGAAR